MTLILMTILIYQGCCEEFEWRIVAWWCEFGGGWLASVQDSPAGGSDVGLRPGFPNQENRSVDNYIGGLAFTELQTEGGTRRILIDVILILTFVVVLAMP